MKDKSFSIALPEKMRIAILVSCPEEIQQALRHIVIPGPATIKVLVTPEEKKEESLINDLNQDYTLAEKWKRRAIQHSGVLWREYFAEDPELNDIPRGYPEVG